MSDDNGHAEELKELFLNSPLPDRKGKLTITRLTNRQADWKPHPNHPMLMLVTVWHDGERRLGDVYTVPLTQIRCTRAVGVRHSPIVPVKKPGIVIANA